ncbi:hypothetical protein DICPUDRAFT_76069 [Dictyostelium purpureum]|uniref:Right handed beta helix domain-containing protein n=1 Tax=Dictyostelium purpureum TaxID=5786 RepID=F0ZCI0_DICPU|nr:uncharacterized protein DICPUDRAFT_76069 [Dictyostelium purpureum]EGC38351.1 hypothetical protein DICPUDRAFT_76069 [Dictyostelium purpureum]|eukprot:XP_003285108.1 hypothetical protein DICPUDRAFT_76069 [Dictyostelium purpureum]
MKLKYFILFYFIGLLFNFIISLEVLINIDYSSIIIYENYECGGTIYFYNGVANNSVVYPPCRSFKDAGIRSRQFQSKYGSMYSNTSLVFLLNNYDSSFTIKEDVSIGEIKFYCYTEIRVKENPESIISIDGSTANSPFITYSNEKSEKCYFYQKVRLRIKNIVFSNWLVSNKEIFYINNYCDQTINSAAIEFSQLKTDNIYSFINSGQVCQNKLNIFISNCDFVNNKNEDLKLYFIKNKDNMVISKSRFENIKTKSFIIDNSYRTTLDDCYFNNINLEALMPLFYSRDGVITMKNILIENSLMVFLFLHEFDNDNDYYQIISNFTIKQSSILENLEYLKTDIGYDFKHGMFIFESTVPQSFKRNFTLDIDNLNILSDNKIPIQKSIFFSHNNGISTIKLKNSFISDNVYLLSQLNGVTIDLVNNNSINSGLLSIGRDNKILLPENITQEKSFFTNKIKYLCEECDISFIKGTGDKIDTEKNDSNSNSNSSLEKEKKKNISDSIPAGDFKKKNLLLLVLLPVLLGSVLIVSAVVFIVIIKIKKHNNNDNNNEIQRYEYATGE